jgi:hypothetical protein
MSSQGVMSSKQANNNPGLCPISGHGGKGEFTYLLKHVAYLNMTYGNDFFVEQYRGPDKALALPGRKQATSMSISS